MCFSVTGISFCFEYVWKRWEKPALLKANTYLFGVRVRIGVKQSLGSLYVNPWKHEKFVSLEEKEKMHFRKAEKETLPIIIKRCWNNTGFLNLLWCKLEKGDFAISLFSSNFFFKHLLFSLSTKLVFVRSHAFKSSTLPSVCILQSPQIFCLFIKAFHTPHRHTRSYCVH